jgi:hypothetical protein
MTNSSAHKHAQTRRAIQRVSGFFLLTAFFFLLFSSTLLSVSAAPNLQATTTPTLTPTVTPTSTPAQVKAWFCNGRCADQIGTGPHYDETITLFTGDAAWGDNNNMYWGIWGEAVGQSVQLDYSVGVRLWSGTTHYLRWKPDLVNQLNWTQSNTYLGPFTGNYSITFTNNQNSVLVGPQTDYDTTINSGTLRIRSSEIINTPSDCDGMFIDKFFLADENDLNPTIEFPNGPDVQLPLVPDEQKVELEPMGFTAPNGVFQPGGLYHLTITGNWNTSRTDYSYSYDNTNWHQLSGMAILCGSGNDVYFESDESYFYIRANDTAEAFANNTPNTAPFPTWTLSMAEQVEAITCSDKFDYDPQDDWLVSGTIQGNDAEGVIPDLELTIGDWYVIETTGTPWYENGTARYDLGIFAGATSGLHTSAFTTELSVWQYTDCVEDTGTASHKRYFFQAPNPNILLRVNDQDNNFTNNTGQIGYNLYHVDMIRRFRSACETIFNVGDLAWSRNVEATQGGGVPIYPDHWVLADNWEIVNQPVNGDEFWVGSAWYMLETTGGPWLDGVVASWKLEYTATQEEEWNTYDNLDWAECAVEIDPLGHVRIYFQASQVDPVTNVPLVDPTWSKTRVYDILNEFGNNAGGMSFDVYKVTNERDDVSWGTVPREGTCNGIYSQGDQQSDVNVNPKRELGVYVPALIDEHYYSVDTRGYWTDNGSGVLTTAKISDDDGATWYAFNEYPSALCQESFFDENDEVHFRLYFKSEPGRIYKIRAATADSNWTNNTDGTTANNGSGPFGIKVYEATAHIDPWNTCAKAYSLFPIKTGEILYSHLGGADPSDASRLDLVPGELYSIEMTSGEWYDPGDTVSPEYAKRDYQLSFDDGVTWYDWNDPTMPGFQCKSQTLLYGRSYFNAANANTYARIRVKDRDGDFTNNTGQMMYTVYASTSADDSFPDITKYVSPSATVACTNWATRPKSILDLGAWIEYARGSILRFFLWCPEHTAALTAIMNDMKTLEPIKTIVRFQTAQKQIAQQIDSYQWTLADTPAVPFSEGGGTDIPSLIPSFTDSPYAAGGGLEFNSDIGGGTTEITACNAHIVLTMGDSPLAQGFCTVMTFLKITTLNVYVNIAIVLTSVLLFIRYLMKHWVKYLVKIFTHSG